MRSCILECTKVVLTKMLKCPPTHTHYLVPPMFLAVDIEQLVTATMFMYMC